MLAATLEGYGDVEGTGSAHSATHSGHGNGGDVVKSDVSSRLRHEEESAFQTEEVALVGLDRALDTRLLVV